MAYRSQDLAVLEDLAVADGDDRKVGAVLRQEIGAKNEAGALNARPQGGRARLARRSGEISEGGAQVVRAQAQGLGGLSAQRRGEQAQDSDGQRHHSIDHALTPKAARKKRLFWPRKPVFLDPEMSCYVLEIMLTFLYRIGVQYYEDGSHYPQCFPSYIPPIRLI